ncbi:MAG: type II toxin-antitoxin system HigB family toxin [Candidatus Marinimicrobia bacterium]|nr:type II toxin-antitoxin system HigB family toxin [Candidatus Neomarinimicrobiota bacterium]
MRIITRKRLIEFAENHSESKNALDTWFHIMDKTNYSSFADLRKTFPSADKLKNLTVFNIGGNKIRLITAIHYNTKCVYLRYVLTHAEYDKGNWKKDLK